MSTSLPQNSSSPPRPPLTPLSISSSGASRPLTPTPTYVAAKGASLPQIIRRKPSLRTFHHPHLDSSESIPSAHSSLYDASLQTLSLDDEGAVSRNWDGSPSAITVRTSPVRRNSFPFSTTWNPNDENNPSPPNSRAVRKFSSPGNDSLHTPHVLAPITERPSNTTLRPSVSSRRKASLSLPAPHTPLIMFSTRASQPFPIPPRSPHRPVLSLRELAALADAPAPSPHLPPRPPPPRIATPPGLPTFNSSAAASYRLPAPPMRRRDRFRPATPKLKEWRAQTARLPKGVVMRGDGGVLVRGRFRWGGGGEVGHMSRRHPWNQRTDADADTDVDGTVGYVDRLRRSSRHGEQSDMAIVARWPGGRESREGAAEGEEQLMNRNGQEGDAAASAAAAAGRMQPGRNREGKGSGGIWDRAWKRASWVCCGAEGREEEEEGESHSNVVIMDGVSPEGVAGGARGVAGRG